MTMAELMALNFNALELLLRDAGALGEASEVHGQLCGSVCLMGKDACSPWVADVLANTDTSGSATGEATQRLDQQANETFSALEDGDLSFTLMLPDDAEKLELRADAIGQWCQGFMHGLGIVGGSPERSASIFEDGSISEIIQDFSEITRAGFTHEETEIEAEAAITELVEYVRVCVQLIYEDLHAMRSGSGATGAH